MKIRRYYKRGVKYDYTWSDKYYEKMVEEKGFEEATRIDNASYELVLETPEEQKNWFHESLNRVIEDPRFYLDNLDKIATFRVAQSNVFDENNENFINEDG